MEYRILGPLTVTSDGVTLPIRGRHRPRLLAMLLLEPGRTVTVARLATALWDTEPPGTARRQVQNHLAALRRTLGPGTITTTADGYRLETTGAEIDSLRFRELVNRAREDFRGGRHTAARSGFAAALGLWRGTVLEGLDGRVIDAAAARWEEQRLGVAEEHAEAGLALGRNAEVVAELRDVLRRWPFRQRVAELSMLGLYRDGHRDAALADYDVLQRRLAEELGIDPDDRVRRLRQRIVDGAPPEEPTATESGPVPAQLPRDIATFTGRGPELAALDGLLAAGGGVAVLSAITGGGGLGKTALAVHWGLRHREAFPDGQLFVDLRGFDPGEPVSPHDALSRFLRALGVPAGEIPTDLDQAATRFRSLVDDKRILIVLDNARDVSQVRSLLPGGAQTTVLVTSRDRMIGLAALNGATLVGLDVLSTDESLLLLSQLLGADRVAAEPGAARRLAELCGRLPLALRITAANLGTTAGASLADHADELAGAGRLERLALDGDAAIGAVFDSSTRLLEPGTRNLLWRLALIPGEDFHGDLAVRASGSPETVAGPRLRQLEQANLVEHGAHGRYRLHDLVREYGRHRSATELTDADRAVLADLVIDWHYDNRFDLGSADRPNMLLACDAYPDHPRQWRLLWSMHVEPGPDLSTIRDRCRVSLRLAEAHGDLEGQSKSLALMAQTHTLVGEMTESIALSRRALATALRDPDGDADGVLRNNLARDLSWNGDLAEAADLQREALRISREQGDEKRVQVRLSNLGGTLRSMGRFDEAEELLRSALSVEPTSPHSVANTVSAHLILTSLYLDRGDPVEADRLIADVLPRIDAAAEPRLHALSRDLLGRITWLTGDPDTGRARLAECAALSQQCGLTMLRRQVLFTIADLELDGGDVAAARTAHCRAEAVTVAQPRRLAIAEEQRVTARLHNHLGEFDRAAELAFAAATAFADMPADLGLAHSLAVLADALTGLNRADEADAHRRRAHAILTRLGLPVPPSR